MPKTIFNEILTEINSTNSSGSEIKENARLSDLVCSAPPGL